MQSNNKTKKKKKELLTPGKTMTQTEKYSLMFKLKLVFDYVLVPK